MCSPEILGQLIQKYKGGQALSSEELKTLVEGLDELINNGEDKGETKIAASYILSRIAGQVEELQTSITAYGTETRANFAKIAEILEGRKKPLEVAISE